MDLSKSEQICIWIGCFGGAAGSLASQHDYTLAAMFFLFGLIIGIFYLYPAKRKAAIQEG